MDVDEQTTSATIAPGPESGRGSGDATLDLFGWHPEVQAPNVGKTARLRRRIAVLKALETPWEVWNATTPAARTARRYLTRHPDYDRPDPAYDLLTDRQAAAEYHLEEAALEAEQERP